jgi:hypothetical protein
MTVANDIAAVRARLPYFDRRALSQAWFSAFHLASDATPPAAVKHAFAICEGASGGPLPRNATFQRRTPSLVPFAVPRPVRWLEGVGASRPADPARRGERVATHFEAARRFPPLRASFTIAIEGARVQILLRREGQALHVVALCTRRHLELVRRALACAGFALRAQGEEVRSSLRASQVSE